eukprot:scaffold215705_cov20-Tisochrysis_lutea.AAC.2
MAQSQFGESFALHNQALDMHSLGPRVLVWCVANAASYEHESNPCGVANAVTYERESNPWICTCTCTGVANCGGSCAGAGRQTGCFRGQG